VKLQDFFYLSLAMSGASPEGREHSWVFFQKNLARYEAMLEKAGPSLMDAVIVGACRGFATADKAAEVRAFFAAHPLPRNERKIAQVVEGIEISARYLGALEASDALAWLTSFNESHA
jgi:hypothetical protein